MRIIILLFYCLIQISFSLFSQELNDTTQANQLKNQALQLMYDGQNQESIDLYKKLVNFYHQENMHEVELECLANICYNLYYLNQLDKMIEHASNSLNRVKDNVKKEHPDIALLYIYLGLGYIEKFDYQNAYINYKKALEIQDKYENESLISTYSGLATISFARGDDLQGLNYQKLVVQLEEKFGRPKLDLAYSYGILANAFADIGNDEKAAKTFATALQYGDNDSDLKARVFNNIARILIDRGFYDSALIYLKTKEHILENAPYTGVNYYGKLALIYVKKKDFRTAVKMMEKRKIFLETKNKKGNVEQLWGIQWGRLALINLKVDKFKVSIEYAQKAISLFIPNFLVKNIFINPSLETIQNERWLVNAIDLKAKAFANWGLSTQDTSKISMGSRTYKLAIECLDKMRNIYEAQGSKSKLAKRYWYILEDAIRSSYQASQTFSNPTYAQEAFFFAEKGKSIVVKDAMADMSAKSTAQLPQEVIDRERGLKLQVTAMERKLLEAKKKKKEELISKARTNLFYAEDSLLRFTRNLEREYPRYHQLKYQQEMLSVSDIQDRLRDDQAIVEYFVGDSNVYVFTIAKEVYELEQLPRNEDLEEYVDLFRKSLDQKRLISEPKQVYADYGEAAYQLYDRFLKNSLSKLPSNIEQLIIIPDGALSYVPFELLIQSQAGTTPDYRQLDFILRNYRINYAYSAQLYFSDFNRPDFEPKGDLLAFAPSYGKTLDSTQAALAGRFRDQLVELRWNKSEVNKISQYLDGSTFLSENATEAKFKELAEQYRIIHLAMHALVDDDDPLYSRLAFSNTPTEEEDDFLNVYELYNMNLNADLAVLSACNTGFGKLVRGEGIMSLARSFAYAGCPSVVMSHWPVDDEVTNQLMETFYRGLSEGLSKSEALRAAQLAYLNQAGAREAHPIYWGSFVLIGKDDPITSNTFPWWGIVLGLVAVALGGVWWFRKR